jgi:leucyl aminopeptidase
MLEHLTDRAIRDAIPIEPIAEGGLERWLARQRAPVRSWIAANRFLAKPGQHLLIPDAEGRIGAVALGVQAPGAQAATHGRDIWSYGGLPLGLPEATYRLPEDMPAAAATAAGLGWALGGYGFTRYKKPEREPARLVLPKTADKAAVRREARAVFLVRDLVTTPAEDMGPAELADAARAVAGGAAIPSSSATSCCAVTLHPCGGPPPGRAATDPDFAGAGGAER